MERKLLLLGLLRSREMHGYEINELLDTALGSSVQLKKPTAYRLLAEMADVGWVTSSEEQEGNRPPRRVYAITPRGQAMFRQLLRRSLADYVPAEFRSAICLGFVDQLPPGEAAGLLRQRRAVIRELLRDVAPAGGHSGTLGLLVENGARHLEAELAWLDELIESLEAGFAVPRYRTDQSRTEPVARAAAPPAIDAERRPLPPPAAPDTVPPSRMLPRGPITARRPRPGWRPEID
jgi:DNA-binding PadR family transcriptional regulator